MDLPWLEPFEWEEPAEWHEALDLLDLAEQMLADERLEAALWLLYNREKAGRLYDWPEGPHATPPASEHYRHTYLWDSGFFEIIYSQAGLYAAKAAEYLEGCLPYFQTDANRQSLESAIDELQAKSRQFLRLAVEESFCVANGQKPNGFIAGTQYTGGWLFYEVEKALSIDRVNKSTHYSQPPILPLGAMSTYKSLKEAGDPSANAYLEEIFYYMNRFMDFFQQQRRNGPDDPLMGVIDPHETGWDSATRWDSHKPNRKPRTGPDTDPELDDDNRYIDGAHAVMRQVDRFVWARNNPERQRRLFWANDVFMNAIYFHNTQVMAWMSAEMADQTGNPTYQQQAEKYQALGQELGQAMHDKMWITDLSKVPQKGFYSLKADGEPYIDISPNNIFALLLPDLSEEQLEAILDMMDEHFDVEYPLPSTSTKSPAYDPHNQERDRLWRGSTWININYYLAEFGLRLHSQRPEISLHLRQRCIAWAERLAIASNELIDLNHLEGLRAEAALELVRNSSPDELKSLHIETGASEHYQPHLGLGQRSRVKNFGWTWLARFMHRPPVKKPAKQNKEASTRPL